MRIVLYIFSLLFLASCAKPEDRDCWKTVGEESQLELPVDSFDKMYLKEHVRYVLVQDTVEKVVLSGGKNLLNFIEVKVEDGTLKIHNLNKCNFLRSYKKKVTAEIHFKQLINIHFEGTEPMTNIGKLNFNWMTILIRDGAGPVSLNFDAQSLFATISHGWGDFTFTGNVRYANLNIRSNGYCDTYGMTIQDSLTVISNTQGTVKVNANNVLLKAETILDGDILYKGVPTSIQFNQYGSGELIDAN